MDKEMLGGLIELPSVGSGHRRIMLKLIEDGFHIMITIYGSEANFDATCLIQAMENRSGNPILLKLQGNTFKRFTKFDLLKSGFDLPTDDVFPAQEREFPWYLNQMEDKDDSESEADPFVDAIHIKQNGLIEVTGMVFKNQPNVRIKWTVIDGVKKVKSGFEKGVSLNADPVTSHMPEGSPGLRVSEGSHGSSSVVTSESSFSVTSSLMKMLRFIGENAQISYSGGISAIIATVSSLLQPAGDSASVDYIRMGALASSCLFAVSSGMLTMSKSKSKKDLGIMAAACAFFSMIIGLFSVIFSHIPTQYRLCFIFILTSFLLAVAFYASGDRDIETTSESGGDILFVTTEN